MNFKWLQKDFGGYKALQGLQRDSDEFSRVVMLMPLMKAYSRAKIWFHRNAFQCASLCFRSVSRRFRTIPGVSRFLMLSNGAFQRVSKIFQNALRRFSAVRGISRPRFQRGSMELQMQWSFRKGFKAFPEAQGFL